jgi:hypothetical protein
MSSYRHWCKLVAHGLALIALISGGAVLPATAVGSQSSDTNYCADIPTELDDVRSGLEAASDRLRAEIDRQTGALDLMLQRFGGDKTELYQTIDAARQTNLKFIPSHEAYASTMMRLTAERRQQVAKVDQQFATSLRSAVEADQAVRAGQIEAYRIAVTDALTAAQTICQETDDGESGRPTLLAALTKSRRTYAEQRQRDGVLAKTVSQLAAARRQSITTVNHSYLLAAKAAQADLQTTVD